MNKIKHLGLRVEPSIHAKIYYISRYEGRSINGQVLYLIQKCIREFEELHGAIHLNEQTKSE